jgi:hypothetical protein
MGPTFPLTARRNFSEDKKAPLFVAIIFSKNKKGQIIHSGWK